MNHLSWSIDKLGNSLLMEKKKLNTQFNVGIKYLK